MLFDKFTQNILELPGVEGLCLVDAATAALLYNRMPSFIPAFAFETALRRVCSLYETIDESYQPTDDYVLKFTNKSLVLRRSGEVILLLLVADTAHLVSLRIVTNIVLKNLQGTPGILAELRQASPVPAASPAPTPPAAAAQSAEPPPPAGAVAPTIMKSRRVYRGVVIEN